MFSINFLTPCIRVICVLKQLGVYKDWMKCWCPVFNLKREFLEASSIWPIHRAPYLFNSLCATNSFLKLWLNVRVGSTVSLRLSCALSACTWFTYTCLYHNSYNLVIPKVIYLAQVCDYYFNLKCRKLCFRACSGTPNITCTKFGPPLALSTWGYVLKAYSNPTLEEWSSFVTWTGEVLHKPDHSAPWQHS